MKPVATILPFPIPRPTEEQFARNEREAAERRALEQRQRMQRQIELLENMDAPRRITRHLANAHADTESMAALAGIGHDRVIVLVGGSGIGKTMAALHWLAHASGRPWFATAPQWAATPHWTREWARARVAVLDDLGTEDLDRRFQKRFNELVTHFHGQCYGLVVTTNRNMTKDIFRSRYGVRVLSRIEQDDGWIDVGGPDLRAPGRHQRR